MSSQTTSAGPTLPPLYFQGKQPQSSSSSSSPSDLHSLPPETVHRCLSGFCDWGTLALLASVQSSWRDAVRDAADHGGRDSKWELACALLGGTHGLGTNPSLAVKYLRELAGASVDEIDGEAAESNDKDDGERREGEDEAEGGPFAPAMRELASCHLSGTGVARDATAGLRWLKVAYRQGGDVDAAHELALIYEHGRHDTEIDVVAAAGWFRVAAEAGHVEAMSEYALCCELGCGVDQDDTAALEWYMKAAQSGHVGAKYSVGEAFEEARGVPQSDAEACLWYYKAAREGDEDSKRALRRLGDIARIVIPGWESVLDA